MKRAMAAALVLVLLLTGLPARAEDHLVSIPEMEARLSRGADRVADLAASPSYTC